MIKYLARKIIASMHADVEHYREMRKSKILIGDFESAAYCQFKAHRAAQLHNKIARFFGEDTIAAV